MATQALRQLDLDTIVRACHDEAQQRREAETGHCFELFRRALDEHDQEAWAALAQQYRVLMLGWVHAYPSAATNQEEAENIARESLEKFWRTLAARSGGIGGRFEHVGALLKYLHQCVITTILDQQRRQQRQARLLERLSQAAAPDQGAPSETELIAHLDRDEQIQRVRAWLAAAVTDTQEQRVIYLSYDRDLSPAEIADAYPQEFATAQLVRQIKERVLKRARRALLPREEEAENPAATTTRAAR